MISFEALFLFVIMICTVFLTVCMIVGIVFLVRYYSSFKKMEEQLELLKETVNDNITPAIKEFRETTVSLRELIITVQDSVSDFAALSMIKKVSPKLAGLKLGLDLGLKAYESFGVKNNGLGKDRKGYDIWKKLKF